MFLDNLGMFRRLFDKLVPLIIYLVHVVADELMHTMYFYRSLPIYR